MQGNPRQRRIPGTHIIQTYKDDQQDYKLSRFEAFKQQTLPRLKLRNIVKIQSLARGYIARKVIFKRKAQQHIACIQIVDQMTSNFISDRMLPDILIEILRHNNIYENVGLYSDQNQALYQTRQSIMDKVLKQMMREVISASINHLVSQFMRDRVQGKNYYQLDDIQDPLEQKLDPISRLGKSMMDDVMRKEIRQLLKKELNETDRKGSVINDYRLQAQFIPFYNNRLLLPLIYEVAEECILQEQCSSIVDEIIQENINDQIPEIVREAYVDEKERESKQIFDWEAEQYFIEQFMFQNISAQLMNDYITREEPLIVQQQEKELEEFKNAQEIIYQKQKDEQIYRNELTFKLEREKEKLVKNYNQKENLNYQDLSKEYDVNDLRKSQEYDNGYLQQINQIESQYGSLS